MKKTLTMVLALVLVFALGVGGTLAWLNDKTETVTNTFSPSDIDIDLTETWTDADKKEWVKKMVPGATLEKDPKVTVEAGSEACYVFIKVEESSNLDDYVTYAIDSAWLPTGVDGVYYQNVTAEQAAAGWSDYILVGNTTYTNGLVTVNTSVTKAMMNALEVEDATQPTLTFTAYAIQSANLTTTNIAEIWALAQQQ